MRWPNLFFSCFGPEITISRPVTFPLGSSTVLARWVTEEGNDVGPSVNKFDTADIRNGIGVQILYSFIFNCEPPIAFFVEQLSTFRHWWS